MIKRIRPIRTEEDLDKAIKEIENLDENENEYFEILSILIEHYERENYPTSNDNDAVILHFLIGSRGVPISRVIERCGIPDLREVLNGKRELSRREISLLAEFFVVSRTVFK